MRAAMRGVMRPVTRLPRPTSPSSTSRARSAVARCRGRGARGRSAVRIRRRRRCRSRAGRPVSAREQIGQIGRSGPEQGMEPGMSAVVKRLQGEGRLRLQRRRPSDRRRCALPGLRAPPVSHHRRSGDEPELGVGGRQRAPPPAGARLRWLLAGTSAIARRSPPASLSSGARSESRPRTRPACTARARAPRGAAGSARPGRTRSGAPRPAGRRPGPGGSRRTDRARLAASCHASDSSPWRCASTFPRREPRWGARTERRATTGRRKAFVATFARPEHSLAFGMACGLLGDRGRPAGVATGSRCPRRSRRCSCARPSF